MELSILIRIATYCFCLSGSSKSLGQANIEQIKSYFTDEQVVRSIAGLTGMDFDTLVGGEYRLLLEPISFLKFQGTLIAVTATEAALYLFSFFYISSFEYG